ncbi:hypothetical protein [Paenibacillus sp. QZ-Y1]|uniref:hypothetical protein n=1 Tax=Paenibacillus sp. QZ-Y1 TaxID=3414511 RepID=UPI003F79A793
MERRTTPMVIDSLISLTLRTPGQFLIYINEVKRGPFPQPATITLYGAERWTCLGEPIVHSTLSGMADH